jgi:hypothetical protein
VQELTSQLPRVIAVVALMIAAIVGRRSVCRGESPLSPEQAATTFRLADKELVIELVAAEPDVLSPVAIAWDEQGRMLVAEAIEYPLTT